MPQKEKDEYVRAKIAVWWDMKDCPIPEGYDARRVRPSIEGAFKKRGYSGPVSITAYGDQKQAPDHLLRGLSSSGVAIAHTMSESTCSVMYSDLLDWRSQNPPPATMMLISNQVEDVFSWDLVRLQQATKYNLFLAYSYSSEFLPVLDISEKWRWKKLIGLRKPEEIQEEVNLPAMFYCKSCDFHVQSLEKFRKHLSSKRHALEEVRNPTGRELDPVTRLWGRNYVAQPEYATAKIMVWWDMYDCPIPEGYDPRWVRSRLEGAFKNLCYSGPVSITAYGDLTQIPDHILGGLSSTGVSVAHTLVDVRCKRMVSDLFQWQNHNPPPATMMLISDQLEHVFSHPLAMMQQQTKYNLFWAYSCRPYKMSFLVTSAEWLWDSLLAERARYFLHKCTSKSTGMFYCKMCYCDCKGLDHFREHLLSKDHTVEERNTIASIRFYEYERQHWIDQEVEENFPKSKRFRKVSRTGFRLIYNHLRLTNRRRARKSQTCKKEWLHLVRG